MRRTVDTYTDTYPTATQVDDALDHASHRGVVTNWFRLHLAGKWLIRIDYEQFEEGDDFAYASQRDRDLGEGLNR